MPQIDRSVSHITKYVITPTAEQIIEKLLKYTGIGINRFKGNIYYSGIPQTSEQFRKESGELNTAGYNRLDVEISPNLGLTNMKFDKAISKFVHNWNSHRRHMDYPILQDVHNGITIHEYQLPISVDLNFKMRFPSLAEADHCSLSLYNIIGQSETATLADITFWYLLPEAILVGLYKLFPLLKLKKHQDGRDVSFQEYVSMASNKQIDLIRNKHKSSDKQLGIHRTYSYVPGMFSYDFSKPEPEITGNNQTAYTVSFTFTFQFASPSYLRLEYPILIQNQYVPKELRQGKSNLMMDTDVKSSNRDLAFQTYFIGYDNQVSKRYYLPPFIKYPINDEWEIKNNFTSLKMLTEYHKLFQCVLGKTFDPETGSLKLELDLDDTYFKFLNENDLTNVKDAIQEILDQDNISEDSYSNRAPILAAVYENDHIVSREHVRFSKDQETGHYKFNMDNFIPKGDGFSYRLCFGFQTTLRSVSPKYLKIMCRHTDVFTKLVYDNITNLEKWGVIDIIDDAMYDNPSTRIDNHFFFRVLNYHFRIN